MKKTLENLLLDAVHALHRSGDLPVEISVPVAVERTRDTQHGDFATNLAMTLAKAARRAPRAMAEKLIARIEQHPAITKAEIAGPGFINFFLTGASRFQVVHTIHELGQAYGHAQTGVGQKIQVEFVSANPTGPLHVGHGRGAAYGATVANLLEAIGFEVVREYYVNDAGRQMDILATSVWLRYLEAQGIGLVFPANGYRGEYVRSIAQDLMHAVGDRFLRTADQVHTDLPPDEPQGGDKELHIDALIARAKFLLGEDDYRRVFDAGLTSIQEDIRQDLDEFGVRYQRWFSERSLTDTGAVQRAIETLRQAGYLYTQDGALWFASSRLGDEKDRVVVRDNGQATYFASDIAYHLDKFERGFDRIINIWGSDHHGYIPRVKAALEAMGQNPERLQVLLVQFAVLWRGEERVQMSTRSGEFVTLRQLRNEIGKDAARFFYVLRKSDQHMDFDLELATARSNENPVYYVQYAHARICSVFRQLDEKGWTRDLTAGMAALHRLEEPQESALLTSLSRYPEVVETSALNHEPHHLAHYLRDLAHEFHTYYNAHSFLVEDADLRNARLNLIAAVRRVLANGLYLLDVSAPEAM
ncbi:MAG: arginine--tRNA ligase [Methylococcaceae bacterium]